MNVLHKISEQLLRALQFTTSSYAWLLPTISSTSLSSTNKQLLSIEQLEILSTTGDFPSVVGLSDALVYTVYLGILRLILQYFLFRPLAIFCLNLKTSQHQRIYSIEKCLRRLKDKKLIDYEQLSNLLSFDEKFIMEYTRIDRQNQRMELKISKFVEALWRFIFYLFFVIHGYSVLFASPTMVEWITDSKQFFHNWPFHPISPSIHYYYQIELACYIHQIMWTEVSRSDALEMLLHHIVTIALLIFSYLTNFTRIGVYILFVHDSADIFLELGKVFNYIQRVKGNKWAGIVTDCFFAVFTITFFFSRLIVYPRFLVYGFITEAYSSFGLWPGYWFYTTLLVILQCLHVFWFYLILRMIYQLFLCGVIEKDARSDDDEDEDEHVQKTMKRKGEKLGFENEEKTD